MAGDTISIRWDTSGTIEDVAAGELVGAEVDIVSGRMAATRRALSERAMMFWSGLFREGEFLCFSFLRVFERFL